MAGKPVSQSNTMWVAKGTIVNGKKVSKGYVAQLGKPEKRVTSDVKLVVDTKGRGKAGQVVSVNKPKKKSPTTSPSTSSSRVVNAGSSTAVKKAVAVKKASAAQTARAQSAMARSRGRQTATRAEAAGKRTAGVPVSQRKPLPRQPGESVQAYNDRIRNAPLANWFSNLGKGGGKPTQWSNPSKKK